MNGFKPFGARLPSSPPISAPLILLVVLTGIGLWTSFYTIPAESEGIVLRFGKYIDKVPPGLHLKLPFGIDSVMAVPIQRQLKQEFGFATRDYTNPDQVGTEPAREKSMVTGDLNSVLVEWIVQYRITEPEKYLFAVREPGQTLRDISESVMRGVVGDRTVDAGWAARYRDNRPQPDARDREALSPRCFRRPGAVEERQSAGARASLI